MPGYVHVSVATPASLKPIVVDQFASAMYTPNCVAPSLGHDRSMQIANSDTVITDWHSGSTPNSAYASVRSCQCGASSAHTTQNAASAPPPIAASFLWPTRSARKPPSTEPASPTASPGPPVSCE